MVRCRLTLTRLTRSITSPIVGRPLSSLCSDRSPTSNRSLGVHSRHGFKICFCPRSVVLACVVAKNFGFPVCIPVTMAIKLVDVTLQSSQEVLLRFLPTLFIFSDSFERRFYVCVFS